MKNSFNDAVIAKPEEVKGGTLWLLGWGRSYSYRSYGRRGYSCW